MMKRRVGVKADRESPVCVDTQKNSQSDSGVHILTSCMQIFGLYHKPQVVGNVSRTRLLWHTLSKVYSVSLVVTLWINFLRLISSFINSEVLFWKLLIFLVSGIGTFLGSTTYVACSSGKLDEILKEISTFRGCRKRVRSFSVILCCTMWIVFAMNMAFVIYAFYLTDGILDILLVPFGTLIPCNSATLTFLRVCYTVLHAFVVASRHFPVALLLQLAFIYHEEFEQLAREFQTAVEDHQVNAETVESFRFRHQSVSRSVRRTDRFASFYNATNISVCIGVLIIVLFNMIWYPRSDPIFAFMNAFWLIELSFSLSLTAGGGILVNHSVSDP